MKCPDCKDAVLNVIDATGELVILKCPDCNGALKIPKSELKKVLVSVPDKK